MPLYEYVCRACYADFEAIVASAHRDGGQAICPKCGGEKIVRKISLTAPAVVKSGRSGGSSMPEVSCGASNCCGGACGMGDE